MITCVCLLPVLDMRVRARVSLSVFNTLSISTKEYTTTAAADAGAAVRFR